ncbi:type VI secretion system-associated protein TagO [Modicisalibacter coralii]|uniref:type VI secretion system-associated protein TagO n=1 Tax=Modicisalibacter coralii TaxID=2304602 RepID=UPI001396950F|nr:type VI secretion system-associated protein TagO [Halomonas coralii]
MDDSPAVALTTNSEEIYTGAYGGPAGYATLHLRCLENSTNLYVKMNGHFLADSGGYGRVTYRIDDNRAHTVSMHESTDNKALGLWSGGRAIPVIRRFFGHDQVIMRVTPFNQSPVEVKFPIKGIEEKIKPLRTACHW